MEINSIVKEGIIVKPGDSLSSVAGKMFEKRQREALVMDREEFLGMIIVDDIIRKRTSDPDKTKISSLIRKINPLPSDSDIGDVINTILINNYTSVPVSKKMKGSGVGIVTKMDVLNAIKSDPSIKERIASDAMKFPYQISPGESIYATMSIMRELNVSRLPVVNDMDEVEGLVNTLDLLKASFSEDSRQEVASGKKENIEVSSFMRKNIPRVSPDMPLAKAIELMVSNKSSAIVEKDGKLAGLITPNDILKVLGEMAEGYYLTIRGMEDEAMKKDAMEEGITDAMKKISKIDRINYIIFNVSKYKKSGKNIKYSIRTKLVTQKGVIFAKGSGWDIIKETNSILGILEREIIKKKEKGLFVPKKV